MLVYCHKCKRKIDDCEHCVYPIDARHVPVIDEKVSTLTYSEPERILQVDFKDGQVWQLSPVTPGLYRDLCESTIYSFLKFMSKRCAAVPVKRGAFAVILPDSIPCEKCKTAMVIAKKILGTSRAWVRIFWQCPKCPWHTFGDYGER